MGKKTDWFPSARDEQLSMGKNWVTILSAGGPSWNIPAQDTQELSTLVGAADAALAEAKNEATRTPVVTAKCKEAFQKMEDKMRDIKKRYAYVPPLTEADIVSLGLKPRDPIHSPGKAPTAHVSVETFLAGRHELGARLVYVTGNPGDRENKGYRIWYTVVAPGETAPADPEQLTKSFYTQRRRDLVEFGFGDSGKTAYFAVQVENDGKKGPWGPLVSALIP
jgi:hypothetical protein